MNAFAAIILVCLASVPPDACDETSAVGVLSTRVFSELRCTMGWQEVIARTGLNDDAGKTYLKTLCRRIKADDRAPAR